MKTRPITHVVSTDLKENVFNIVQVLMTNQVDVISWMRPNNVIFINVPKTFDVKCLNTIKGIKSINLNK